MRKARLYGEGAHVGSGHARPSIQSDTAKDTRIRELDKVVQILKDA
ncbi:MAG: hypothetical protein FWG30_08980 [Eubacteriaceae bacterium]|nr:hypothetical protein [Eubacteriaceae bacterium]